MSMRFARFAIAMCVVVGAVACTTSSSGDVRSSDAPMNDAPPQAHGDPCEATARGQGVTITVRSASCDYDQGSTATFEYEIAVDETAPALEIAASMGCGSCRSFSTDVSSWTTWTIGGTSSAGSEQRSCSHCLVGCCSPDPAGTYRLDVGTTRGTIEWSGRTTGGVGPDDGMQPDGAFFAPGRYDAAVSVAELATARLPFVIRAR